MTATATNPALTSLEPLAGWSVVAVTRELREAGYAFSVIGNDIDADVVRDYGCPECGSQRCRYEAWRRPASGRFPRGYRALSICRDCQYVFEF